MDYEDELDRMRAQKRRSSGAKRKVDNLSGRAYYEKGDGRNMRDARMYTRSCGRNGSARRKRRNGC